MIDLGANVPQSFIGEITPAQSGDTFTISLGQMLDWSTGTAVEIPTSASTITIDNISITKK
uniref:hypothetical protein n=1 Tax=Acetatifactor sp. TaxID=1872090 RepID=UPI0040566F7B